MMKMAAFNCRKDEIELFDRYSKSYGIELVTTRQTPTLETIEIAKGCDAISVITTPIDRAMIDRLYQYGVKVISTRTIGFEHIDYSYATSKQMVVSNVSYTPHTVAEYAVMMMLMLLRKMKTIMIRSIGQDYGLKDIRGRELSNMTVGVVGTGKIGETVINNLSGFGCRLLAYDLYQKDSVKQLACYEPLDTIFEQADIITLHAPATEETFHLINDQSISKMKDGVIIINTARGALIETKALIKGLVSKKIGGAALDVIENEGKIYYRDFKYEIIDHPELIILNSMPNVLMTPHTAFFTDEAVGNMVEYSIRSSCQTLAGEENPWRVN